MTEQAAAPAEVVTALSVNSVFEVQGGKITVWRDYFDLNAATKIHEPDAA